MILELFQVVKMSHHRLGRKQVEAEVLRNLQNHSGDNLATVSSLFLRSTPRAEWTAGRFRMTTILVLFL